MACMYLLRHPDHYTSHIFQKFYWRAYVHEVRKAWETPAVDNGVVTQPRLVISKGRGNPQGRGVERRRVGVGVGQILPFTLRGNRQPQLFVGLKVYTAVYSILFSSRAHILVEQHVYHVQYIQ